MHFSNYRKARGYYTTKAAPKDKQAVAVPPIAVPAIQVDELVEITDDLRSLIGVGTYGRVYYGVLRSGQRAAIKILDSRKQPDEFFLAQVSMASRLKHDNLIELLGYCLDGDRKALAYEFASYGSLYDILHEPNAQAQPRPVLSWSQRSLVTWATPRLSEDKVKHCVDPRLYGDYPPKAVAKMAAVAALCVQYEAEFRPSMGIVIKALQPLLNARAEPLIDAPHL
ncbi:hypothetical protein L1887_27748 [Cichorium endivia]|nr:hypothetical protein L1887_27748 [Cichorium endivia]